MDISILQRNPEIVQKALREEGNSLVAAKRCKILIPEQYFSTPLGILEEEIKIIGIFCIVVDDTYYAVSRAAALVHIEPSNNNVVTIDGTKYMEFIFEPGDRVMVNINLVQTPTIVYRLYDIFIAKGKIPWYIDYSDLAQLFDTALLHGGANLRTNNAILEMIVSSIARDPKNRMAYYRHAVKTAKAAEANSPDYIGLRSVAYSATNTTAKLLGNYLQEGVSSALVSPTERSETIEDLLRK